MTRNNAETIKIEIIIPNYNGFSLLEKNILKVFEAVTSVPHILVTIVDDKSSDQEQESVRSLVHTLKEKDYNIQLLENDKNMGFAGTVNKAAFLSQAEYLVFLNSDVIPSKGFLRPVLQHLQKDPLLFGVGCMDQSVEGTKIIERGRGKAIWKKGLLIHSRGETDKADTFWISGGSSIVRRDLFIQLGGFDEVYRPFYWEDIDLSFRAQKAGFHILFERESVVIHEHSKGSIKQHYSESYIKTIAYRNQFIFLWKNITAPPLFSSHLKWLPYHITHAVLRGDITFFKGFLLAIAHLPVIMQKRKNQKRFYRKNDTDIISVSLYS